MSLSEIQQANTLINRSGSILLIVPAKASLDASASMIALYCALQPDTHNPPGQARTVEEISPSHIPAALQFLSGSSQVKVEPVQRPQVVIEMAGPHAIDSIQQEPLQGGLRLNVSFPPHTSLTKDQIETSIRLLPYDLVVTIGAADLEELGPVFTKHADFFYNTPLVNIDHRAANENFGTVNLVDITAGSHAEVVYDLLSSRVHNTLGADTATALYSGIVAGTDSFQKPSTTPRSFHIAAQLVEQHADRESVIQYLVKTKPLKLIKLTGSLYAHLQHEEQTQLYWTLLEHDDFRDSNATADDIPTVMNELVNNIAGFTAAFLIYEPSSGPVPEQSKLKPYYVYIRLGNGLKRRRREIQEILSAEKENGSLTFSITAPSIEVAEKQTHEKIKQILP